MDGLARFLLVTVGLILAALAVLGWRNRVMVRLGLRNIPRRRAQTAMIVFGLMLSTLIISAAFGTGDTMSFSLRSFVLDEMGEEDEMVRWSFLLESSFVAFLGIFIGIVLGLILAYNFYNGTLPEIGSDIELSFVIPWTRLGLIVAIAYGASLVTTYLPAWQAARVYPAEALRYE